MGLILGPLRVRMLELKFEYLEHEATVIINIVWPKLSSLYSFKGPVCENYSPLVSLFYIAATFT